MGSKSKERYKELRIEGVDKERCCFNENGTSTDCSFGFGMGM
jgi:hypothetical protein